MENHKKKKSEEPKIYSIQKNEKGSSFSRKEFLSGMKGVGLAGIMGTSGLLSSCAEEDTVEEREIQEFGEEIVRPCDGELPFEAICVCDCVTVGTWTINRRYKFCSCDTITIDASEPLPSGAVCICNTITNSVGSGGGGGGSTYWYPN